MPPLALLTLLLLTLHATCASSALLTLDLSEFKSHILPDHPNVVALLLPSDDCAECNTFLGNFQGCFASSTAGNNATFAVVSGTWAELFAAFKLNLPRITYFENGQAVKLPYFGTSKSGPEGVCRFAYRVVRPLVESLATVDDIRAFLSPADDSLRDVVDEDPVSFVFLEPEFGSFFGRAQFEQAARLHRTVGFFGVVKEAPGFAFMDALGLGGAQQIALPALVRVETGRASRVLLSGRARVLEDGAIRGVVNATRFATVATFGLHNFKTTLDNDAGLLTVMGLVRDPASKDRVRALLESLAPAFSDRFAFGTIDFHQHRGYLSMFVEFEGAQVLFVYDRRNARYWVYPDEENVMSAEQFLEGIVQGTSPAIREDSWRRVKALALNTYGVTGLAAMGAGLVLTCLLGSWMCCGASKQGRRSNEREAASNEPKPEVGSGNEDDSDNANSAVLGPDGHEKVE